MDRVMTLTEGLAFAIEQLDSIGFDIGSTRISIYRAGGIIVVVAAIYVAAHFASRASRLFFRRITGLDATQRLLGEKIASIAVWLLAVLIGIDILGIDLTALTVFSGAFGLAVGFGLQKTFGNLIAGIILLMDRSIKPGDVIAINDGTGNTFGQVKKIGIRAVSVTTRDEREYLIPNENLMINQVENWSYSSRNVRIQIHVGVGYATDIRQAEALMLEAAKGCKRILADPAPTVWLDAFGDSRVQFVMQCWINDPEVGIGNVRSDVLKRLWWLFKDNGIELPFPQRDINLRETAALREILTALHGKDDARSEAQ